MMTSPYLVPHLRLLLLFRLTASETADCVPVLQLTFLAVLLPQDHGLLLQGCDALLGHVGMLSVEVDVCCLMLMSMVAARLPEEGLVGSL